MANDQPTGPKPSVDDPQTGDQRREDFALAGPGEEARDTVTVPEPGLMVQTTVSPTSSPSSAATASGMVARIDDDLSSARTALDSKERGTTYYRKKYSPYLSRVGIHVGRPEGTNGIYSRSVGIHVGQHMPETGKRMSRRERRALELLHAGHRVIESSVPGVYLVPSETGKQIYKVKAAGGDGRGEECTCADFEEREGPCKHIFMVRYWLAAANSPAGTPLPPLPPKRVRPNQRAYDLAQNEEYPLFGTLLRDLCAGIPEPDRDPRLPGRPAIPLRELAFCAVKRAYLRNSCRRSEGFLRQSVAEGHLSRDYYWDVPSKFLCRDDAAPILHDLLARSAIPLIGVDTACAIDSSGFRTTRFHYYNHEKYQPTRQNVWLKAHILAGVQTHAVPVLEITEGSAGDSPRFPVLLKRAVDLGFTVKEVYADKGYLSRNNFEAAAELGVDAFIPFKVNSTGQSKGTSMYHKMFLFFQYHREKFDQHYGQRAQVETCFGAIKQKFGETLESRNFTAQVNELVAKLVAYNISVLIRQMFERDLLPDFLRPPVTPPPAVWPSQPVSVLPQLSLNPGAGFSPVAQSLHLDN
jgi:hypothetical protein